MVCLSIKRLFSVAASLLLALTSAANAQWQQVGPPSFTSQSSQAGCATTYCDGVIWAGGHSLWSSTDLSVTWQQSSTFPLLSSTIYGICFFDRNTGYVLADGGAYMTRNGGKQWTFVPVTSSRWGAFGSTADTFYVSGFAALKVMVNGVMANSRPGSAAISPIVTRQGTVFYLDDNALYRSNDGGITWKKGTHADIDCNAIALDSFDPNMIYLVNEEIYVPTDDVAGIYVSNDLGSTWSRKNPKAPNYYCGNLATSSYALYTQTQDGIIRSTDKGDSWSIIGGPN